MNLFVTLPRHMLNRIFGGKTINNNSVTDDKLLTRTKTEIQRFDSIGPLKSTQLLCFDKRYTLRQNMISHAFHPSGNCDYIRLEHSRLGTKQKLN
jgi:hypothetical protein